MINRLMTTLLDELCIEEIADPLGEPFTLAALWEDLARLAGETPPPDVRRRCEDGGPTGDLAGWGPSLAPASAATGVASPTR